MQEAFLSAQVRAKPFFKWAGGKTQLLEQIKNYFPPELGRGEIKRYVEPFVGSGAVFFYIAQTFRVKELHIGDLNEELVLAYKAIRKDVKGVIQLLTEMQEEYLSLSSTRQQDKFYEVRGDLNRKRAEIDFAKFGPAWVERTAELIFLNKTCFNGLFRVNGKGEFNVPFGRYKSPTIFSADNLRAVSEILQSTEIRVGDFAQYGKTVDEKSFVYFDPPYRPISATSNFTSYSKQDFGEQEQERLSKFYKLLAKRRAKLMLSNSDAKDNFFEKHYKDFRIYRVQANRLINCDATKRGKIDELLMINYEVPTE